jgi:hypothetical protein
VSTISHSDERHVGGICRSEMRKAGRIGWKRCIHLPVAPYRRFGHHNRDTPYLKRIGDATYIPPSGEHYSHLQKK